MIEHKIVPLPKDKWRGYPLALDYETSSYYDMEFTPPSENPERINVCFVRRSFPSPIKMKPIDRLYPDWWECAEAYGIFTEGIEDTEHLIACIETWKEEISNRFWITNLWVKNTCRHMGLGRLLMNFAKTKAWDLRCRALILETESCNVRAIGFYLSQGLTLFGFDRSAYTNRDMEQRELKIFMGMYLENADRFLGKTVTVRVDRQLGSVHPNRPDIVYPINYGFIEGEIVGDGEDQDAYVLGEKEPLSTFIGRCIAVIHRHDDGEDKLVVAKDGKIFTQNKVAEMTHFQEQYFRTSISSIYHKSAGMIVFRRNENGIEYLLLFQRRSQTWSFPKGHIKPFESELDAALREVREEVGMKPIPYENFRAELTYPISEFSTKTVALFLAEAFENAYVKEEEIAGFRWVRCRDALKLLPHGEYEGILKNAEKRITAEHDKRHTKGKL